MLLACQLSHLAEKLHLALHNSLGSCGVGIERPDTFLVRTAQQDAVPARKHVEDLRSQRDVIHLGLR